MRECCHRPLTPYTAGAARGQSACVIETFGAWTAGDGSLCGSSIASVWSIFGGTKSRVLCRDIVLASIMIVLVAMFESRSSHCNRATVNGGNGKWSSLQKYKSYT